MRVKQVDSPKKELKSWIVLIKRLSPLLLAVSFIVFSGVSSIRSVSEQSSNYPELQVLQEKNLATFKEISEYFQSLAQKKGAPYAYELLKIASIPPNIDLHLMGHIVGDELYKQMGVEGIKYCTEDFRNACSHSVVVAIFQEKGELSIPEIAQACQRAPGGSGAYTMCFHGLGHGVLASLGYNLIETVEVCRKTATAQYQRQEFPQCVSGAVMETISGGFHDREIWAKMRTVYLKDDSPLAPCSENYIPAETKVMCYSYLTPRLFEVAGGDLNSPTPSTYEAAFSYCASLPQSEMANRQACFGGFGKEFVVLALERDIRKVDQSNETQMKKVVDWCLLAKEPFGIRTCLNGALGSYFWGGENDRSASLQFCDLLSETDYRVSCYSYLIGSAFFYVKDEGYLRSFCEELPSSFKEECRSKVY